MTPDVFFSKFETFATAPNAVDKFRELVLRVAMSGRMTDRVPGEKSGSQLIAEIQAIKADRIRRGLTRARVEGEPIRAGDTVDLPATWARCTISQVCDLQTGATPSRQEPNFFGGGIRWLVSGDVNQREIFDCEGRITAAGLNNSNCKVVPADSVLIALNGQGRTRGTVALLRVPAALNQSLVAITPYSAERLSPEFMFWNLRSRYFAIRDITGQDQRRGLNMKLVGQLTLPFPPFSEQKRIVAKVDELMALCDRLEVQQLQRELAHAALTHAALARFEDAPTPTNLGFLFHESYAIDTAALRQSVLTIAMRGKIVSQNPRDGDARDLLDRIIANGSTSTARRSRIKRTDREEDVEAPYALPENWTWTTLGTIAAWGSGSTPPRGSNELYGGEHTWLKSGELNDNQALKGSSERVTDAALDTGSFRRNQPGDVLFAMYGATVGKVAILAEPAVTNQAVCGCTPCEGVLNYFLFHYLVAERQNFRDSSEGGAQPNFSKDKILTYPFPLPPLAEQRRIVAKVDELMAFVDQLEAQLVAAHDKGTRLMEAVVAELTSEG